MIEAIKLLREEWSIDLKDAKDIVDQHIDSNPLLNIKSQRQGILAAFPRSLLS